MYTINKFDITGTNIEIIDSLNIDDIWLNEKCISNDIDAIKLNNLIIKYYAQSKLIYNINRLINHQNSIIEDDDGFTDYGYNELLKKYKKSEEVVKQINAAIDKIKENQNNIEHGLYTDRTESFNLTNELYEQILYSYNSVINQINPTTTENPEILL